MFCFTASSLPQRTREVLLRLDADTLADVHLHLRTGHPSLTEPFAPRADALLPAAGDAQRLQGGWEVAEVRQICGLLVNGDARYLGMLGVVGRVPIGRTTEAAAERRMALNHDREILLDLRREWANAIPVQPSA